MARADSLFELIKYGLINDFVSFRKAVEALCVEERAKQHTVLANKIQELLLDRDRKVESKENVSNMAFLRNGTTDGHNLFWEKIPKGDRKQWFSRPDALYISPDHTPKEIQISWTQNRL